MAARRIASRIAVVREAVGLAAYAAGDWATAIAELRTYHRMTGKQTHLAEIADCERALGRPERAIDLYRGADKEALDKAGAIELLIVAAGARGDLGQHDAAVAMLQVRELTTEEDAEWAGRLRYAYADALLAAGRRDEAREWFSRAAAADPEDLTDAAERLLELDGVTLEEAEEDEDDEATDEEGAETPTGEADTDEADTDEADTDEAPAGVAGVDEASVGDAAADEALLDEDADADADARDEAQVEADAFVDEDGPDAAGIEDDVDAEAAVTDPATGSDQGAVSDPAAGDEDARDEAALEAAAERARADVAEAVLTDVEVQAGVAREGDPGALDDPDVEGDEKADGDEFVAGAGDASEARSGDERRPGA